MQSAGYSRTTVVQGNPRLTSTMDRISLKGLTLHIHMQSVGDTATQAHSSERILADRSVVYLTCVLLMNLLSFWSVTIGPSNTLICVLS
jgi:hypothetical protein